MPLPCNSGNFAELVYRYTAYAGSSLFGLSSFYSELMKGVGAASRLFELQDRKPSISPTGNYTLLQVPRLERPF